VNKILCQWLTSDPTLFELDWLKDVVFKKLNFELSVEQNPENLKVQNNTILICNHAVSYRGFLDKLRAKGYQYGIVLLSDENLREPNEWLHDPACKFLIRNYVHPNQLMHPKVITIGLGYKRNFTKHTKNNISAEKREFTWCFAGTLHGERSKGIELFKKLGSYKVHSCSGFGAEDGLSTENYTKMLNNSIFALCPPGQDSNDSFRLYEALEAGCIPVTLANSNQFIVRPSYWNAVFRNTEIPYVVGENYEEILYKTEKVLVDQEINKLQELCKNFWNYWKEKWATDVAQLVTTNF
jgi:hypothetical protein